MATPQFNPSGFRALGSTLAGGNAPAAAYAEAQGENLGANTQRAIAEANAQFEKNKATSELGPSMTKLFPNEPDTAAGMTGAAQAGLNLEQLQQARLGNQKQGFETVIGNPNAPEANRVAGAQAIEPTQLADPNSAAKGDLVSAQAQAARALGGLRTNETNNPSAYHPTSSLNTPPTNGQKQRLAYLESTGTYDPATISRFAASPGAIDAAFSAQTGIPVEALAEADRRAAAGVTPQPGATPTAPPQPGATPTAPPQPGATPTAPLLTPGGNAHAEIRQSDMQFASVKPTDPGGKIRAGNALTAHLGLLQQLHDAQEANDLPAANRVLTALGVQAGGDAGTQNALASHVVGAELNSFLVANGGAQEERQLMQSHFNQNTMGGGQLQSNINDAKEIMGGQFASLKKAYSTPSARTDQQVGGFSKRYMLDPSILDNWEQKHGAVTRGGFPTGPGTIPPPPNASGGTVPPAPAASGWGTAKVVGQ